MDYPTPKQEDALNPSDIRSIPEQNRFSATKTTKDLSRSGFSKLASRLFGAARELMDLPRRHAVRNELRMLSDRELTDIGLSRSDVAHIYDADFSAARDAKIAALAVSPRRAAA